MNKNKKLITYALPYANGPLHLGHMMGLIQVDCYARALRMAGEDIMFVCGDDAHGTPIMLNAQKKNMTPEELIKMFYDDHVADLKSFSISVDGYHSTHDVLNFSVVHNVYQTLDNAGCIGASNVNQAFDEQEEMFLPDRYIKGVCPLCGAKDQYGDHCEVCGKTYAIEELKSPRSTVSNTEPVWKTSEHFLYKLSEKKAEAELWLKEANLQESVRNKLEEWFVSSDGKESETLKDWDISRDAPYFGIDIPGQPNKYFYVWLDAPFGYMSSMGSTLGLSHVKDVFDAWNEREIIHFIGKDIVYFHGIFWPSVLKSAGLRQPSQLHVHGFLTMAGDKMSKSRGTFVAIKDCLAVFSPDMLRYYFASRLSIGVTDVELNWDDFRQKINSDLVGKLANIGSRSQGFLHKHFDGKLGDSVDRAIWDAVSQKKEQVEMAFSSKNMALACRLVMEMCDEINQYIDHEKPWVLAKSDDLEHLHTVVTTAMNLFRLVVYLLAPITPSIASRVAKAFYDAQPLWAVEILLNHNIDVFEHLVARVSDEDLAKL